MPALKGAHGFGRGGLAYGENMDGSGDDFANFGCVENSEERM
jgi:hypothetical protein